MRYFCYYIFSSIASISFIYPQVSHGGTPKSQEFSVRNQIEIRILEEVDVDALLEEDEVTDKEIPFRFGFPMDVEIGLLEDGTWEELQDGGKLWRVDIISFGAHSINLIYDRYNLPDGAELFVYSPNYEMVLGAFTSFNNKEYGGMATSPIEGDEIIVEYYEPADVEFPGELNISHVVHGYKDVFFNESRDYGDSGSCNNNVQCPEGDLWDNEVRATAMILLSSGSRLCSGSMVNNVRQDLTPYFLTANHCIYGDTDSWIIMFNYESPSCSNQDGPTNMTVQGTTLHANYSHSDFALFELSENPPESYNVHYAGWSAVDLAPPQPVGIHHPSGDIKKISFDYDTGISDGWSGNDGSHWRVADWEDGTTEPGSSGSPLFDANHHIVGQLHGGEASCSYNVNDYYGKFARSWDYGAGASNSLVSWLDPDNTGTLVMDGTDALDLPDPALTYDAGDLDFELTMGETGTSTISISNTGEPESILYYNLNKSPFESVGEGPDDDGNFWTDSDIDSNLDTDWIDISGMGTQYTFPHNDQAGESIEIGFDFPFYGESFSECIINSNGWVGFGADNTEWDNFNIPSSGAPKPAVMGFWDDLNPVNDNCNEYCAGEVFYHSNSERLVVWFNEVAHWWTDYENSFYDFQMVLYATGEVRINYNSITGNHSPTIGMQNSAGDIGFQISYNGNYVHNDLTISFKPGPDWLAVSNAQNNELLDGMTADHTLTADSNESPEGDYNAYVIIQSNAESPIALPITMSVGTSGLIGDVNGDGVVNILDVVTTVNFVIDTDTPTPSEFWAADINGDDVLNVLDIVLMINIILDT